MEKKKIKILEDLCIDVNETNTEILFKEGDIIENYSIMTIKKTGEKNYIVNGYVIPSDVVEEIENDR